MSLDVLLLFQFMLNHKRRNRGVVFRKSIFLTVRKNVPVKFNLSSVERLHKAFPDCAKGLLNIHSEGRADVSRNRKVIKWKS